MKTFLRSSLRAAPLMLSALMMVACIKSVDYAEVEQPKAGAPGEETKPTDKPGTNVPEPTETTACVKLAETAAPSQKDAPEILGVCNDGGLAVVFTSFKKGRALKLKSGDAWFAIAKLVPGDDKHTAHWQSYINKIEQPGTPGAAPLDWTGTEPAVQATTEFAGAVTQLADSVTTVAAGIYLYKFQAPIMDGVDSPVAVAYEPALTHRVGIEFRGDVEDPALGNPVYTWQPSTGNTTGILQRDMVSTATCNTCHNKLELHGGARVDTKYCVLCHNPGSTDAQSGNSVNLNSLVHKLHSGKDLPSGKPYVIWGYMNGKNDFSTVAFPQDRRNCRTCHDPANPATPQASEYLDKPTIAACTTCHDTVSFAAVIPPGMKMHEGGAQADDTNCQGCHRDDARYKADTYHRTPWSSAVNPDVPAGDPIVVYTLKSMTLAGNPATMPVVTFGIRLKTSAADPGTPLDLKAAPVALSASVWSYGSFGGKKIIALPSFLVAFSVTESTYATMDWASLGRNSESLDFNNWFTNWSSTATKHEGKSSSGSRIYYGQPQSIALANAAGVKAGYPQGTTFMTNLIDNGDGTYTTKPYQLLSVPVNAKNPVIVLQGYVGVDLDADLRAGEEEEASDTDGDGFFPEMERFADASKIVGVGIDDTPRRKIVSKEKCAVCHERLALHGGNRVADPNVCVVCHNPNATDRARRPSNPIDGLPEQSIVFSRMIHRIHKGEDMYSPEFVIYGYGGSVNDFKEVRFPGNLKQCETCHEPGTYEMPLSTDALAVSMRTGYSANTGYYDPKAYPWDDENVSPLGAACTGCHDNPSAEGHANVSPVAYSTWLHGIEADSCEVCHGPGTSLEPAMFHK